MTKRVRLLWLVVMLLLAGCIPVPHRVMDEFSPPDGKRPNNFELTGRQAEREEGA